MGEYKKNKIKKLILGKTDSNDNNNHFYNKKNLKNTVNCEANKTINLKIFDNKRD